MKSEDSDKEFDEKELNNIRNIPYDPDLYDLNSEISKLRNKAELEIKRFIEKTKENPKMAKALDEGV